MGARGRLVSQGPKSTVCGRVAIIINNLGVREMRSKTEHSESAREEFGTFGVLCLCVAVAAAIVVIVVAVVVGGMNTWAMMIDC